MRKLLTLNVKKRIGRIGFVSAFVLTIAAALAVSANSDLALRPTSVVSAEGEGNIPKRNISPTSKTDPVASIPSEGPADKKIGGEIRSVVNSNENGRKKTQLSLLTDDNQAVRDSTYAAENNVGNPPGKVEMDSPNISSVTRIRHRAGIANFSFDVPFASLPGRGINASIGMTYNSRVWNKSFGSFQFDVDKNWLAPGFTLGFGKLTSHFETKTILLTNNQYKTFNEIIPDGYTDPDGTRHQLVCKTRSTIPGTQTFSDNTFCSEYGTNDGTFVKVLDYGDKLMSSYLQADMSAYASTYFTLIHSDGSRVKYSVPGSQFAANDFSRDHYPVVIQDSNGNQIDIAYKDGKDNIDYIRDTLGRYIKFYYDTSADKKLVAVTVPGFNGGSERQTIRFYYDDNVSLDCEGRFTGNVSAPATFRALRYVYFPATESGYRYDYHPNFGSITKITKLMGMTVSGNSLTSTGTITSSDSATAAATTEYSYVSDGGQTPLTDVPKFNQRTDDWLGRTSSTPSVTYYNSPEPAAGADRITTITVPQEDFAVQYITVQKNTNDWQNGLTKETTVARYGSPQGATVMAKTAYTWDLPSGGTVPIVKKVEVTNDANQTKATEFGYDGYNNTTLVRECDFAPTGSTCSELRRTETNYETGSGWINNQLVRLPKEVKTTVNGTAVSKVQISYDQGTLALTPGVIQQDPAYNPNQGTHTVCHWECNGEPSSPRCPDGTPAEHVCEDVPNYDPSTNFRGNVTRITSFSNATLQTDPNASVKSMAYDMTGNVVQASMSCCNTKSIEYSAAYQYAYPTREVKGAGTQLVNSVVYDLSTGLVLSAKNENDQQTSYTYDPDTLRQTRIDYPNGAWATSEINNTQFPYYVKSTSSLDASRSVSSWSFINGAGAAFRSRSQTANGYFSSDIEFDSLGRATKSFSPYTVAGLNDVRPTGIKFSEITQIDALGRPLQSSLPDGTIVQSSFSGTTATIADQAGKQRRQVMDALGRTVRVDEPDVNGNLGAVASPVQPTYYEYDGNNNLTKVTKSDGTTTQQRLFKYDSLSRLIAEKQVEANATLNDSGIKQTSGGLWTGVYKYNTDGLLIEGVDARGVKTTLTYDGVNRVLTAAYTGETGYQTPTVTYTYDEAESGFYNNGRLTKVQTVADATYGTPATVQNYRYDKTGQVVKHTQSIGDQAYNLQYGYNLAGQVTTETYPSGKVVTNTIDNFGGLSTVADAQKTYLSGITTNGQGLLSQINLGNGTSETYAYNDRLQMKSQSLHRGSEVLQKYDYSYGTTDLATGTIDTTKNNGQLGKIESTIGANKQWSQRFGYDELGRLKEAREYRGDDSSLTYKQVFDFDRFGNLYRKVSNNPTTGQQNPLPYTPIEDADISKSKNRLTTGTIYDDAGSVITDNKFRSMGFSYDANGRIVKATKTDTPDARTVYDALGNRVATKVNDTWQFMVYDAFGKLVAEYGNPQPAPPTKVKYIQQDWQGSVRTVANSSGFVISRTDHQAFGDEINQGIGLRTSQQGYSGISLTRQGYGLTEKDDATGLNHTGFRKNDNQAGRWTSPDPYKGSMSLSNPQSFNRYSYTGSDPINHIDPSGLQPCEPGQVLLPGGECGYVVNTNVPRLTPYDMTITPFGDLHLPDRPVPGDPGGGGPNPCARMAANAEKIVTDIYKREIANNDLGRIDFGAALLQFDERFSFHYFGAKVRDWGDLGVLVLGGGTSHRGPGESGQQDFRPEFQQDEQNGSDLISPNGVEKNPDQTHHFAAYLSAGINMSPSTDLATAYHYMGDRNDGNEADTALAMAAYNYGVALRKDPGGNLGGIKAWILKNICQ